MNKKFFVPYKTAQQLKEKGYPQEWSDWYYHENIDKTFMLVSNQEVPQGLLNGRQSEFNFEYINAAPTYHEVVDWLEGKGIRIEVRVAYRFREKQWSWCGYVYVVEDEDYETSQLADWCSTREGALNAAILKALETL